MNKELEVAKLAAKEAGKILAENFGKDTLVTVKKDTSLVTQIDKLSEKKIISIIKEKFPDHGIIAEESGSYKKQSEYLWFIDPLDGTGNYAAKIPLFTVSIALAKNKKTQIGVVYEPILDELYITEKNKGASNNDSKIRVSEINELKKAIVSYNRSNLGKEEFVKILTRLEPATRTPRIFGSITIQMCYLAAGIVDAVIIILPAPWDLAASCLLVEEAGGKVTDFEGDPWSPYSKNILASNGRIHKELLEALNN